MSHEAGGNQSVLEDRESLKVKEGQSVEGNGDKELPELLNGAADETSSHERLNHVNNHNNNNNNNEASLINQLSAFPKKAQIAIDTISSDLLPSTDALDIRSIDSGKLVEGLLEDASITSRPKDGSEIAESPIAHKVDSIAQEETGSDPTIKSSHQTDNKSKNYQPAPTFCSFDERIEQLKAFKDHFGHLHVVPKLDEGLYGFCERIRELRSKNGDEVMEASIKKLGGLGFPWYLDKEKYNNDSKGGGEEINHSHSFDSIFEQLKAFKEKRGHLYVTSSVDRDLAKHCGDIRFAINYPAETNMIITPEQFDMLNSIGFIWDSKKRKAPSEKQSLSSKIRTITMSDTMISTEGNSDPNSGQRIDLEGRQIHPMVSASNVGLHFMGPNTHHNNAKLPQLPPLPNCGTHQFPTLLSFENRLNQLRAFKKRFGHLFVPYDYDKSLSRFCQVMRDARQNSELSTQVSLTAYKIKALTDIGFVWKITSKVEDAKPAFCSFEERVQQLKSFKSTYGHLRVVPILDESLFTFCERMRVLNKRGDLGMANKFKILDDLGFEWGAGPIDVSISFDLEKI